MWYNSAMKLKQKPNKKPGGAAIAERFRLDTGADDSKPTVGKKALTWAFSFGLAGLIGAAVLVAVLYDHWDYMQNI